MEIHLVSYVSNDGPAPTAMYISRGLGNSGQKEIALGVRLRPGEAPDAFGDTIGDLFTVILELAAAGQIVDIGGRSELAERSVALAGRNDFRGIVYTTPDAQTRGLLGEDGLLGILVTSLELEISDAVGATRLLGQLGERARFYPTPPWSDRDRPVVVTEEFRSQSILARVPRLNSAATSVWIPIAHVTTFPGPGPVPDLHHEIGPMRIHMDVAARSHGLLRQALGELGDTLPLAILAAVSPELTRCLTWAPGQSQALTIVDSDRPADPRCAGNFLLYVPGAERNGAKVVEDGFALFLRQPDWLRIRAAIAAGEGLTVPDEAGGILFELAFTP
jgi:hypothetical protein